MPESSSSAIFVGDLQNKEVMKNNRLKSAGVSLACLLLASLTAGAQEKQVKIKIVETSDIHGAFYSYDFRNGGEQRSGLSRISTYLKEQRAEYGDNLILLDNGDILQGQPCVYYFNYMDTTDVHCTARMMNYLRYDVGNMGNHDVETGHDIYDKWIRQCQFPILGANIIDTATGEPYLPPYHILERDGVRIAILGMITPAIPCWLPEVLWKGLRFEDMVSCAGRWVPLIREKEHPDLLIGLFHSGKEGGISTPDGHPEDASEEVPLRVPGFDLVFFGHDHTLHCDTVSDPKGRVVYCLDPASEGRSVSTAEIEFTLNDGKVTGKKITATLKDMRNYPVDKAFEQEFAAEKAEVLSFVDRKLGEFTEEVDVRPSFVGPSTFMSLIHQMQLDLTGAQISLSAPLSMQSVIQKGDVTVRDMFNLYRFENYLYTMQLTGREIKDLLEMSYASWSARMQSPEDDLLLLNSNNSDDQHRGFKNFFFNFDSAAGINYTVDVTKPEGEKITITTLEDGTPFDLNTSYTVAVNSYRGNGGGELLTLGSGIPREELPKRILKSTDRDLRYYLIQYVEKNRTIRPKLMNNWKFIPEAWTVPAGERNMKELFRK